MEKLMHEIIEIFKRLNVIAFKETTCSKKKNATRFMHLVYSLLPSPSVVLVRMRLRSGVGSGEYIG